MHFLRSITNKRLTEEGFLVSQFKRVPNKKRPADSVIKKARRFLSEIRKQIKSSKKTPALSFKFDSLKKITKKSSLKKFKDSIYQLEVPYHDMILSANKTSLLDFNDYLLVTYTKEPEEANYLIKPFGKKRRPTGMQSTNIVLNERKTIIDSSGVMVNPNAIINQGYWAFEAFANMLPLDYQPPKN